MNPQQISFVPNHTEKLYSAHYRKISLKGVLIFSILMKSHRSFFITIFNYINNVLNLGFENNRTV